MSISSRRRRPFTCRHLPMKDHALMYAGGRLSRVRPSVVEPHSYAALVSPCPRSRSPVLSLRRRHKPRARAAPAPVCSGRLERAVTVPWDIAAAAAAMHRRDSDDLFALGRPLPPPPVMIGRQKFIRINAALRPIDHETSAGCEATNCAVGVNYCR